MLKVNTKVGERTFEIDIPTINQLKALKAITGNHVYCFPGERDPNTHRGYFDVFWEKIREEANITQSMHGIRDYFARTLLDLGYDNQTVGFLLGHKDGTMVARKYGSSSADSRKRALVSGRRLLSVV